MKEIYEQVAKELKVHTQVEEEEGEMFPKFDKSSGDKKALLEKMLEKKEPLEEQIS